MNDFLETFIEAGKGVDYRKVDELEQNIPYKILEFRKKKTQFGAALEGEIKDPNTLDTFSIYFPERLARKIKTEEDLKQLNDQQFSFIFRGRENRIAILDFIKT